MRWNRWARYGLAILAPALVGVMLVAGEWSQAPVSSPPGAKAPEPAPVPALVPEPVPAPAPARPRGRPTPEHVRDVQQALANSGYDPGPIDGILGPRTKSALRKYIAVPPPQVPRPEDTLITRFKAGGWRESP